MGLSTLPCPICSATLRRDALRGREVLLCTAPRCGGRSSVLPTVFQLEGGRPVRSAALERMMALETKRQARIEEDDG